MTEEKNITSGRSPHGKFQRESSWGHHLSTKRSGNANKHKTKFSNELRGTSYGTPMEGKGELLWAPDNKNMAAIGFQWALEDGT